MSKSITCDLFPHVRAAFRRSRQREGLCFIFPSQRASPWPGLSQLLPLRTFDAAKWSTAHPPTRHSSICAVRSSHTAACFVDASVPLPFIHPQYAHQISPRAICCTHTFTQSRVMSPTEHAVASSTYLRLSTRPPHTNPPSISPNLAATAHINFALGWQGRAHGLKGGENR